MYLTRYFIGIADKLSNGTILASRMDMSKLVLRLQMTTCSVLMHVCKYADYDNGDSKMFIQILKITDTPGIRLKKMIDLSLNIPKKIQHGILCTTYSG